MRQGIDPVRAAFLRTLAPGDLVLAYRTKSDRAHVVRLGKSKHELEAGRTDPASQDPERTLWDGRALCPLKDGRYYYKPIVGFPAGDDGVCAPCLSRWRGLDSPTIKGMSDKVAGKAAWPLPFGWREVPVVGHPWDVPQGQDPEDVRDGTGKSVGELRVERRRWRRGDRVVRLVEYLDKPRFGARYHVEAQPLREGWDAQGNENYCLKAAWKLMALGGQP